MSAIYLETSAFLHWLFGQPNSAAVRKDLNNADAVVTSVLTLIETERAIVRAEALEHITARQASKLRSTVEKARKGWVIIALSEAVKKQSMQSFPVEPIRTLDALHLASAIALVAAYPDLKILSFDQRVLDNARMLRLL